MSYDPNGATAEPGWYDDPCGRHEHRYFDGEDWSDNVADQGVPSIDPVTKIEAPAVRHETNTGAVVRRTRRAPFIAPVPNNDAPLGITVSRNWAAAKSGRKNSGISRNRVIAGDLPDWSPLPPGELLIDRNAGSNS